MPKLENDTVVVEEPELIEELASRGYGEMKGGRLRLSPEEALFMAEKKSDFAVAAAEKVYSYQELFDHFFKSDKNLPQKYLIYRDLRNRGFCVQTGFKLGSDYRVYPRGKKPGKGKAMWLIHCTPEEAAIEFPKVSETLALAKKVRKKMIYAVTDKEGDITYYKVESVKL